MCLLDNSDLLACTVVENDQKLKQFLVTDGLQLVLVEPDQKKMGWGMVRFVGFLQDLEVAGDKDNSRILHVTIHQPASKTRNTGRPLMNAKFLFDDHIRCMAAKQRLTKGRQKARQYKMDLIADLIEIKPVPPDPPQSLKHMTISSNFHFCSLFCSVFCFLKFVSKISFFGIKI